MVSKAHITLITLGVRDVGEATAFYEQLGFVRSRSASQEGISFFKAGGVALALYGRQAVAEDIGLERVGSAQGAVTLAENLDSEAAVDAFMAHAAACGASILKPAEKTVWGGYSGYFSDPDGHVWEVAHNPFLPLRADGSPDLPD